jgi:hypothetical protein
MKRSSGDDTSFSLTKVDFPFKPCYNLVADRKCIRTDFLS